MLELRYPLFFVHGMGFRGFRRLGYWGRVPAMLQKEGIPAFFTQQDANGSIESNAKQLASALELVLNETGAEKVNIIAHSKGGLEARFLVSSLGYAGRIASVTTLSTPHGGSVTVDKLLRFPRPLVRFGCKMADFWFRLLGDATPHTYQAILSFQTAQAAEFNNKNPDAPAVYYQSYAFVMKHWYSDCFMLLPHLLVHHWEGANDGFLPPSAVQWGNFRGVFSGSGSRGISHMDEVDARRRRFTAKQGEGLQDILELYIAIVKDLSEKGF